MSQQRADLIDRIAALRRAAQRVVATQEGLSLAQLHALIYLSECNRFSDTPAAVAEYLETSRGTTSQTLIALERKGLIARRTDRRDGRVSHARPTAAGASIVMRAKDDDVTRAIADADVTATPDLDVTLKDLLRVAQRAAGSRTFGRCATCQYLQGPAGNRVCGLTHEPLTDTETALRCVEHTPLEPAA